MKELFNSNDYDYQEIKDFAVDFLGNSSNPSKYTILHLDSMQRWESRLLEAVEEAMKNLKEEIDEIESHLEDEEGSEDWIVDQGFEWREEMRGELDSLFKSHFDKYTKEYQTIDSFFKSLFPIYYYEVMKFFLSDSQDFDIEKYNRFLAIFVILRLMIEGLREGEAEEVVEAAKADKMLDWRDMSINCNPFYLDVKSLFRNCEGVDDDIYIDNNFSFDIEALEELSKVKLYCQNCQEFFKIEDKRCRCKILLFVTNHKKLNSVLSSFTKDQLDGLKNSRYYDILIRSMQEHENPFITVLNRFFCEYEPHAEIFTIFLSFFFSVKGDLLPVIPKLIAAKDELSQYLDNFDGRREDMEIELREKGQEYQSKDGEDELEWKKGLMNRCIAYTYSAFDDTSQTDIAEDIGFNEEEDESELFNHKIDTFSSFSELNNVFPEINKTFKGVKGMNDLIFIYYNDKFLFYFDLLNKDVTVA